MSDDELKDLSIQLAETVASRCHHVIQADDPIMTVAVILQVIARELNENQKQMLDDSTKTFMSGTLRMQTDFENIANDMLANLQSTLKKDINQEVSLAMTTGRQMLQEMIRTEFNRTLAVQRAESTNVCRIKNIAQFALAAATLSFLGGLSAVITVALQ